MPNDPDEFKNSNGTNNADNKSDKKDDFVNSSFAVQFKPGDKTESVSDKLKETKLKRATCAKLSHRGKLADALLRPS